MLRARGLALASMDCGGARLDINLPFPLRRRVVVTGPALNERVRPRAAIMSGPGGPEPDRRGNPFAL